MTLSTQLFSRAMIVVLCMDGTTLIPDVLWTVLENCNDLDTWKAILVCHKAIWYRGELYRRMLDIYCDTKYAVKYGYMDILAWLHEHGRYEHQVTTKEYNSPKMDTVDYAARHGQLDVVQWIYTTCGDRASVNGIDYAARYGHLHVVTWLHEHGAPCTTYALDWAASNGHLDIVKFLGKYRAEGGTQSAIDWAVVEGHMNVVDWLDRHIDILHGD